MAFHRRLGSAAPTGLAGDLGRAGFDVVSLVARFVLSSMVVAIMAAGLLYARLAQGPIELPGLGRFLVQQINAANDTVRVDVSGVVLNLGGGRTPTGLEFRNVRVHSVDNAPIFAVPTVRASFHLADLVHGRVRPVRISVLGAAAQFVRAHDGRIRFGLGRGAGVALEDDGDEAPVQDGFDAVGAIIDGFVGDGPESRELTALRRIELLDSRLYFSDRITGGNWAAQRADLSIRRDAGGATALLEIEERQADGQGAIIHVSADRRRGVGRTAVHGRFGRVETESLARIFPALEALNSVSAVVEGEVSANFDIAGTPLDMSSVLIADGGVIAAAGEEIAFDMAALTLHTDFVTGRIDVADGLFSAPGLLARLDGPVRLKRGAGGAVERVDAQLDIAQLDIYRRDWFERGVTFDSGQIALAWDPAQGALEIADSWLARDDVVFRATARIATAAAGTTADIRAEAAGLDVDALVRHWPTNVAPNPRIWIERNIDRARIDRMVAQVRLGDGEPKLFLDAGFRELDARYIAEMSPIREASGTLHLNWRDFYLEMAQGVVSPSQGRDISLAGSVFLLRGIHDKYSPADVRITARGTTAAVLELIDQNPLNLVRKLGFDTAGIRGDTVVDAGLRFPLLNKLQLDEIGISASAEMHDTRLELDGQGGGRFRVAARRLTVEADAERLRLRGGVTINDTPARLDWREAYGERPGQRRIALAGSVTPEVLAGFGAGPAPFGGVAAVEIELNQRGGEPMRFAIRANLRKTEMDIAAIGWSKAAGIAGRLEARGVLGDTMSIEKLLIETEGLKAEGAVVFGAGGRLLRAHLHRVQVPSLLDASVAYRPGRDGVAEIEVSGRMLDISARLGRKRKNGGSVSPFRMRIDLERLKVTKNLVITSAHGLISRQAGGTIEGRVEGGLGPAPVDVTLRLPPQGEGAVTIDSTDAGAALRAADIYRDARGGTLHVEATLPASGGGLTGQARIEDVVVRSQATFRDVLRNGGMSEAQAAISGSGIGFRKVWIPFAYVDGVVTVTDAIAVSPALGLKLTGTLNERTEALDLTGVLSPAYGLTGALNDIPLLGAILSGGQGEGIVAMTFTLRGAMRDPQFSVNPLSLLAPGFLRKLFTGGGTTPANSEELHERFGGDMDR